MHPEGAENENNCDFDSTRECPLSLISRKTFNCLGDYRKSFRGSFRLLSELKSK